MPPTSIFMSAPVSKLRSFLPPTSGFWDKGEAPNQGADMDGNVCATRGWRPGSGRQKLCAPQIWSASPFPALQEDRRSLVRARAIITGDWQLPVSHLHIRLIIRGPQVSSLSESQT